MLKVVCAIITKDKKILFTQRGEKMKFPLKWEFPGGKVEDNETEEYALIREIREELAVEIKLTGRIGEFTINESMKLIPFMAVIQKGEIKLTEHNDYKWLELNEITLENLDILPADISVLKELSNLKIA